MGEEHTHANADGSVQTCCRPLAKEPGSYNHNSDNLSEALGLSAEAMTETSRIMHKTIFSSGKVSEAVETIEKCIGSNPELSKIYMRIVIADMVIFTKKAYESSVGTSASALSGALSAPFTEAAERVGMPSGSLSLTEIAAIQAKTMSEADFKRLVKQVPRRDRKQFKEFIQKLRER